jgi:hypothetical protein
MKIKENFEVDLNDKNLKEKIVKFLKSSISGDESYKPFGKIISRNES